MAQRRWKNLAEYLLFLPVAFVVRLLPRRIALALGALLGRLSQIVLAKRARTAEENLRQAFPEMSETERAQTVAAVFRHLGKSGIEMLLLDTFRDRRDMERYFRFHGLENLKEAQALDRGVFILTGHLGFWEVGTFFLPLLGCPTDFVAKRMKNPYIDRYFTRQREAGGGHVLEARHGARRIMRSLSEKRGVAILLDQHVNPTRAVPTDFFGRTAHTTPVITQIAMKQGTPIVPSFSYRAEDNRYDIYFEPMLLFEASDDPTAVTTNTQRLTASIEAAVRRDITQWFWVHRRWRD